MSDSFLVDRALAQYIATFKMRQSLEVHRMCRKLCINMRGKHFQLFMEVADENLNEAIGWASR